MAHNFARLEGGAAGHFLDFMDVLHFLRLRTAACSIFKFSKYVLYTDPCAPCPYDLGGSLADAYKPSFFTLMIAAGKPATLYTCTKDAHQRTLRQKLNAAR